MPAGGYLSNYDNTYIQGYYNDLYRRFSVASSGDERNRIITEMNRVEGSNPWVRSTASPTSSTIVTDVGQPNLAPTEVAPTQFTDQQVKDMWGRVKTGTGGDLWQQEQQTLKGLATGGNNMAQGLMGFSPEISAMSGNVKGSDAYNRAVAQFKANPQYQAQPGSVLGGMGGLGGQGTAMGPTAGGSMGYGGLGPGPAPGEDPLQWAIRQYTSAISSPWAYNPELDPSYNALAAQAQTNASKATQSAMAELASRGILPQPGGVSTMTGDRATQIQQQYVTEALNALLPSLEASAFGKRQDTLGNLSGLIETMFGQQANQFNQGMQVWQASGKAPSGIGGVTPGTPYWTPGSSGGDNSSLLMSLWQASGYAPPGLEKYGVPQGTPLSGLPEKGGDVSTTINNLAGQYNLDPVSSEILYSLLQQPSYGAAYNTWSQIRNNPSAWNQNWPKTMPAYSLSIIERALSDKWPQAAGSTGGGPNYGTGLATASPTWSPGAALGGVLQPWVKDMIRDILTNTKLTPQQRYMMLNEMGVSEADVQAVLAELRAPAQGPR